MHVVYGAIEFSATDLSMVPKNPTKCVVSECDLELSTMRRSRFTRAVEPWGKMVVSYVFPFTITSLKILFNVDVVHALLFCRVT